MLKKYILNQAEKYVLFNKLYTFCKKIFFVQRIYWNCKGFVNFLTEKPYPEPWMTDCERQLFYEILSTTKVMLEFGSGGSTIYALTKGIKVFSIESSFWFICMMKKSIIIRNAIKNHNLFYHYANIGTTKDYAVPLDISRGEIYWKKSIEHILSISSPMTMQYINNIDTVFIDERYRVACVLNILLNFKNIQNIVIHDYTNRQQYHILDKFLLKNKEAGTLVLCSPKKNIDYEELKKYLLLYKDIYN